MKVKDVRSIIDVIRDASKSDLIIICLLLLPIILGAWLFILNNIVIFIDHNNWGFAVIVLILVIYVAGLLIMKWLEPYDEKLKRASLHVQNRLMHRPGNRVSCTAIREEVNNSYSDKFLKDLIEKNPRVLRTVQVKRDGEYVPGITLGEDESEDTPSSS